MTTELYWISKTVVIEWTIRDLAGVLTNGTIAATITLPDGTTAAGTVSNPSTGFYRISYDPTMAGTHAYRLVATGAVDSAEEGTFIVKASLVGVLPITTDPTTSIGMARLFATDLSESAPIFTDAQWIAFLAVNGGTVRLAAAQALETIAASEVLISKKIRTQDLATDGPAVAKELRELAASLRQQDADGYGNGGLADDSSFMVVDYNPNAWLSAELAE